MEDEGFGKPTGKSHEAWYRSYSRSNPRKMVMEDKDPHSIPVKRQKSFAAQLTLALKKTWGRFRMLKMLGE